MRLFPPPWRHWTRGEKKKRVLLFASIGLRPRRHALRGTGTAALCSLASRRGNVRRRSPAPYRREINNPSSEKAQGRAQRAPLAQAGLRGGEARRFPCACLCHQTSGSLNKSIFAFFDFVPWFARTLPLVLLCIVPLSMSQNNGNESAGRILLLGQRRAPFVQARVGSRRVRFRPTSAGVTLNRLLGENKATS